MQLSLDRFSNTWTDVFVQLKIGVERVPSKRQQKQRTHTDDSRTIHTLEFC